MLLPQPPRLVRAPSRPATARLPECRVRPWLLPSLTISGGQRRREFSAAQHHEPAFEGQRLHAIAQFHSRLARHLVLHQLDTDHQAASAHIAHQRVTLLPAANSLQHEFANAWRHWQSPRDRECPWLPVPTAIDTGFPPNVEACDPGAQSMISARVMQIPRGMPLAMPLAMHTMSGSTPECSMAHHLPVLPAPHWTSSTTSRIPCRSQMARSSRKKSVRRNNVPAFALDRLDEDCRHFFRRNHCLEQLLFDVPRAAQAECLFLLRPARASAIDIGISERASHPAPAARSAVFCCGFEAVRDSAPMVRP
jgi:hypothetical protein